MTGYLAPEGYLSQVKSELGKIRAIHGRLILTDSKPIESAWSQNIWLEPEVLKISSIGDAAKQLRARNRLWALYSFHLHRRAKLIQERLDALPKKPMEFPAALPTKRIGAWTLIDKDTILASPQCSSPFPHGEPSFAQNKNGPPNRAYLKLWEALTLMQRCPRPGDRCLDAGASPGGWTWVLSELGSEVIAVDRSPLAPKLMRQKNIEFRRGDAFSYLPGSQEKFDWIFCDVACYPEKLLTWVKQWVTSGKVKQMVCTLKFQKRGGYDVVKDFKKIPGSRLVHLSVNKHELTWLFGL